MLPIPARHAWTSYYFAAGNRIAMRVQSNQQGIEDGLYYLLTDHLGSTAITLDEGGNQVAELRYSAWGESRYTSGDTPTQCKYTGQKQAELGLYDYGARWYDPALAHFIQADSIVPGAGNPVAWDRYAYVYDNPINFNDPSGHMQACADGDFGGGCGSASTVDTYIGAINDWFDNVTLGMGTWNANDLVTAIQALFAASNLHGGTGEFAEDVGDFTVLKLPEQILGVSTTPIINGMVVPFSKPVMILNGNIFTTRNIGTILHETGHVFDFNGDKKKSDMFVPFFSPGVYCQTTPLGCLNANADDRFKQVTQFYASVNQLLSGTSNFGYNPTQSGTTPYGAVGTLDDWAETYAVMALESAGYPLTTDQTKIWDQRKMIVNLWLNK